MNASINGNTDDDVEEAEDGVKVNLNEENGNAMSPGARDRAVSFGLLLSLHFPATACASMIADE